MGIVTAEDIACAAGFLIGEGSFTRSGRGAMQISAPQTEPEPLQRLEKLFGGRFYYDHRKGEKVPPHWKPIWRWRLCGPNAVGLAMTLYAIVRRWSPRRGTEIAACLSAWRASTGSGHVNRSKTHCRHGHPFEGDNIVRLGRRRRCRACIRRKESELRQRRKIRALVTADNVEDYV